jgi:chaperone required for assembly of F1-ATPase
MVSSAPKKRFWTETQAVETNDGFGIALDGREIKTPGKAGLVVPTRALADMIVAEWDAQGEKVDPSTMPATRGANSAIDTVLISFDTVVDQLAEYAGSDLLCYRAESPAELVARQAETWDPLIEWAAETLDAPLNVTTGVLPIAQEEQSLLTVRGHLLNLSAFELTGMHDLITLSGSAIIGLSVLTNHLSGNDGWNASRVDEDWQIHLWGEDDEASEAARIKKLDFEFAKKFIDAANSK